MAQFDVYRSPNSRSRRIIPFVLVVQSDLLSDLATCAVVPLVDAAQFGKPATRLNPVFTIEKTSVVMSTAEITGIPRRALGSLADSLASQRDAIVAALDFLIFGFCSDRYSYARHHPGARSQQRSSGRSSRR